MKTLLVPIDFTVQSDQAIIYAKNIAEKMNAKVTLFHAYQPSTGNNGLPDHLNSPGLYAVKKTSEIQLKKRLTELEESSSCQFNCINYEGLVRQSIIDETVKLKPELLIMGRERYTPIQRLTKSKTERVIQEVDCNVLTVPLLNDFMPITKIAFAIDYHFSEIKEIEYLLNLAENFNAQIHIVHVVRSMDNIMIEKNYFETFKDELRTTFPENDFIFKLIEGNTVSNSLKNYVSEAGISIMTVSKTKKDIQEIVNSTGVSIQLFKELEIPLLLLKKKKKK